MKNQKQQVLDILEGILKNAISTFDYHVDQADGDVRLKLSNIELSEEWNSQYARERDGVIERNKRMKVEVELIWGFESQPYVKG